MRVEIEGYEPAVAPMKMRYISRNHDDAADSDSGASELDDHTDGTGSGDPAGSGAHP